MVVRFVGGSLNGKIKDVPYLHQEIRNYVPERDEIEVYVLVITPEHEPTYQYAHSERPRTRRL